MEKYDEYKDSGVEWIGEIPNNWNTIALKRTTNNDDKTFIDGDWIESKVITDNGIRYLTTGNIGPCVFKEQGNGFITEKTFKELNCTEVYPGDLLISRLNEPIGRCCIVPDLGNRIVTAVDNVIYRPHKEYNLRYMMYQMNCTPYTENANMIARGSTMHRISRGMLGSFKVCIPPHFEQQAIANYLDKQCSKIDKAIATQEKRIELLGELKQTIITDAVTRGINPNVKMKDSGVEWIGEIPEHWEIMKIRWAYPNLGSGTTPDTNNPLYYVDDGYNWLQTGDLTDGIITSTSKHLSRIAVSEKRMRFYPIGSIVIAMYGATIGKVGLLQIETSTNQACCVLPPQKNIDNRFMLFVLKSSRDTLISKSIGGGQPNISQAIIQDHRIPFPALDEQQAIACYLENKCERINSSISTAVHQIALLKEYKQSLITEVVTGKRKVI